MSRTSNKKNSRSARKTASSVPSFLLKLYEMLETPNESISWSSDGTSFIVNNMNEFSKEMLPKFFKHNNFASFVRQLNLYDFHKIRNEDQEHEFQHRLFRRNAKHLLQQIKRKNAEPLEDATNTTTRSNSACNHSAEIQKLKKELLSNQNEITSLTKRLGEAQQLTEHLMKQNTCLIADTKSLIESIAQQSDQREKNIQKMIYAMFSMIENGSMVFSGWKNNENSSTDKNYLESNSNSTNCESPDQRTNTTVSLFNKSENYESMSFDLEDLSKQISSTLFGNNSNDKKSFLIKHLNQMNALERENNRVASNYRHIKLEDDKEVSVLDGNLPMEKRKTRASARAISQKNMSPEKPLQTENTVIARERKKRKVEEVPVNAWNGITSPINLPKENPAKETPFDSLDLLRSPEPLLPAPLGLSPRISGANVKFEELESTEKHSSVPFLPEDAFLAQEKMGVADAQLIFDEDLRSDRIRLSHELGGSYTRIESFL